MGLVAQSASKPTIAIAVLIVAIVMVAILMAAGSRRTSSAADDQPSPADWGSDPWDCDPDPDEIDDY